MERIAQEHFCDDVGNPAGGLTAGTGLTIRWQNGPMKGPDGQQLQQNGAFVEDVIMAVIGRLEYYQVGKYNCRENALAITKLQEAIHWLDHRRNDRERRGVEGTHKV
jgi:hypothetical protein